jgi:hypothetical protein
LAIPPYTRFKISKVHTFKLLELLIFSVVGLLNPLNLERIFAQANFLAEAKRAGWEIRPTSGEDLQALAKEVIDQPPEVVDWLKKLLIMAK